MSLGQDDLVGKLPESFKIKTRPLHVGRKNPIYAKVVETLKVMDTEKCIEIPMKDVKKAFVASLQATVRRANVDFVVKTAKDGKNWVVWRGLKTKQPTEV